MIGVLTSVPVVDDTGSLIGVFAQTQFIKFLANAAAAGCLSNCYRLLMLGTKIKEVRIVFNHRLCQLLAKKVSRRATLHTKTHHSTKSF